jgi:sugar porter (SP) family MFS transporter
MLSGLGENAWRWMLAVAALPSIVYAALCLFIPESPRWLLGKRQDRAKGIAVLRKIQPNATAEQIEMEASEIMTASLARGAGKRFWSRSLRTPILLAFLVAFFNQLSGINAVLYFAPRIFAMAGLSEQAAMLQSVGIGVVNAVATLAGLWLIDRLGRRTLLYIGSWGYIASLGLIAWAFFTNHSAVVPFAVFAFIAAHAIGQGTVIWVLISEVFPTEHRAEGQALGSFTHWFFAALITSVFPMAVAQFAPGYIFLFFGGMMVLQLLWVKTMVVETRGVPLEQMQQRLGSSQS